MATVKVSALTEKTSPSGSEELLINDSGTSKKITIGNLPDTNTTYTSSDFTHNDLTGVSANEHIDWTTDQGATNIHSGNYTDTNTTYTAGTNVSIDGSNVISSTDTNTTYSIQDGELSQNNFTDADHSKLDGIAASANNYTHPTGAGNEHLPSSVSQTEAGYLDGVTSAIQTQLDSKSATSHNHTGTYEPADATIVKDADIGSTVQAYDADTAKLDTDQSWTGSQRGTTVTDNDGSFDMDGGNNFKCTPTGNFTLTFTNITDGQSGFILLVNSGGHTVSAHANTKVDANFLATVSTAGTYLCSYFSDGTNAYVTNSAVYT